MFAGIIVKPDCLPKYDYRDFSLKVNLEYVTIRKKSLLIRKKR